MDGDLDEPWLDRPGWPVPGGLALAEARPPLFGRWSNSGWPFSVAGGVNDPYPKSPLQSSAVNGLGKSSPLLRLDVPSNGDWPTFGARFLQFNSQPEHTSKARVSYESDAGCLAESGCVSQY
jgi:hypothetical protein